LGGSLGAAAWPEIVAAQQHAHDTVRSIEQNPFFELLRLHTMLGFLGHRVMAQTARSIAEATPFSYPCLI
jgi:hypothetical protein